jgi:hypothetical protein
MKYSRFAKQALIAASLLLLRPIQGLTVGQNSPVSPVIVPHKTVPLAKPRKAIRPEDDLGLTFSEDQNAKIAQIRQTMKSRMDVVVQDQQSSREMKQAMLEGLQRMERRQVFAVLTPEQKSEVRKKILVQRAAERQENSKKLESTPNKPYPDVTHLPTNF